MRRPILRQLLVPMLLVVVLSSAATAVLAAWLGMRAVRQGEQEGLQQLADSLTNSGFPLTDAVLRRMSDLSGARFATLDSAGAVQHVSLTISEADWEELLRVDVAAFRAELPDLDGFMGQFGSRLPARMRAQVEAHRRRLGA